MNIWGFKGKRGENVVVLSDGGVPIFSVRCHSLAQGNIAAQIVATILEIDEITETKTNVQ